MIFGIYFYVPPIYYHAMTKTQSELIRPLLILEQVIERLTDEIIKGKIQTGSQLVEIDLQKRFGISRTPLREAFRELERLGFVTIIPRRGAFVKRLTRQEVIDIYEMRSVLEGLAARLAFKEKKEAFDELSECMKRMQEAYEKKNQTMFLKAHDDFHNVWILRSNNPSLIDECLKLRGLTSWHRMFFKFDTVSFSSAIEVHLKILAGFQSDQSSAETVEKIVRDNVRSAIDRLKV